MPLEYARTDEFIDARFTEVRLVGAVFRDCDLTQVKIVDCWLSDVRLSGDVRHLVVNDVDVTAFVQDELDRRHPERVRVREVRTAADFRATWAIMESLWAQTVARAEQLPEPARHDRVDDEWSFVETMRHLIFATDAWALSATLEEESPYHPLGLPASGYPPKDAAALGLTLDATPGYAEVMSARRDRQSRVTAILAGLTDQTLAQERARPPAPGYPDRVRTVATCLRVVLNEECEHRRYMERDLAALEASASGS